ncbi:MAG: hypothetical protein AUK48_12455 [Oscillatoriales cyanobacterium CG2_30_44_21]|nr:MAG: hypothetical protein AUK48_12455 [Oscillatoriales cyanobacterium CG2_30_44_21]
MTPKVGTQLQEVNLNLVQTIADQQITEDRLNLQLTRLRLMYDFVSALNAAQTINEIYQIALNGICPALHTSRAAVVVVDHRHRLKYQESIGISDRYKRLVKDFFYRFKDEIKLKTSLFPNCAALPSDRNLQKFLLDEKIGAIARFPLEYENRNLGDIIAYFDSPRHFTAEEIQLTQTIITYVAIALTRKEAEIALKESQQFIQRIADTTPSILYIFDIEEYRNIYCNQSITSILGYTPQQIQSMDRFLLKNVVHPHDLFKVMEHYQQIRHSQTSDLFVIEYRMIDAEGDCKWFYSQETGFLRNPDGTIKQTIGCASDITKLKEVETRLQASLVEKEVLIREVHHRVKNNLSVIDSLLSMQARYVHDDQALRLLLDSQRRIHTMALIHEQLYQSHDMGKVDFCEYLHRLTTNLYSSTNFNSEQVQLKLDVNPIILNIDTAISLGLIVNELLTNCFKHAFPDRPNGLIEVILQKSAIDQNLHLIIQDDGIGIPKNIDSRETDSLGLRLVKILAQQLRASFDVSTEAGTSFHFTFQEN